jgi:cellulose biosynthesis protein BcsQ
MRGGVGTSTAALRAAQLLAGQGLRVAVFDAAQRGDLHVMLGAQPTPQPVQHNLITVYLGEPAEEIVEPYEALVIDGGRRHGTFNAQWIEVNRPLDDNALRRLIGLPPEEQTGEARPARRLVLPRILSIEVTD